MFRKNGLPAQKLMGSDTLSQVMKELSFQKREDFFVSIGAGKTSPQQVLTKVMQKLNQDVADVKQDLPTGTTSLAPSHTVSTSDLGIRVEGISDVAIRIPQCCRPVPGDDVVGYISLGRGITIHRRDCPNVRSLEKNPERFTPVHWDTAARAPFRVEIQVEAYDRSRLLEDISRTLSESGVNILAAQIHTTEDNMVRDRFVFEVPAVDYLETVLQRIRRIDTVYDAYRVIPH